MSRITACGSVASLWQSVRRRTLGRRVDESTAAGCHWLPPRGEGRSPRGVRAQAGS